MPGPESETLIDTRPIRAVRRLDDDLPVGDWFLHHRIHGVDDQVEHDLLDIYRLPEAHGDGNARSRPTEMFRISASLLTNRWISRASALRSTQAGGVSVRVIISRMRPTTSDARSTSSTVSSTIRRNSGRSGGCASSSRARPGRWP